MPEAAASPLLREALRRERAGRPARVGVVGLGDFGAAVADGVHAAPGLRLAAACDRDEARARDALRDNGGAVAVRDAAELAGVALDVVVDCTGDVEGGAALAEDALAAGRHVVMVNVEADATVGAALARRAADAGVVYTLADGDQPSLLAGLVEDARLLGLEPVCAGKWTRRFTAEAAHAHLDGLDTPRESDVTNVDGSKTQLELAAAANATGLGVDVPGLHGFAVDAKDLPEVLRPRPDGGRLGRAGVVDYVDVTGRTPPAVHPGGVFAVVRVDGAEARRALRGKRVPTDASGQHALLYRPQHLVGVEAVRSVAAAVFGGHATATSRPDAAVEVVAVAKRPLRRGEELHGLGGVDVRGIATGLADAAGFLPVGLARACALRRDVAEGERIGLEDVTPPRGSRAWALRPELRAEPAAREAS